VALTQVYAVLNEPNGRQLVATWSHIDHGKLKQVEDVVFATIWTPSAAWSAPMLLSGKDAETMKQRLCNAQDALRGWPAGRIHCSASRLLKPVPGAQARYHPAGQQPWPLRAAARR
jgi:hypothetical protein